MSTLIVVCPARPHDCSACCAAVSPAAETNRASTANSVVVITMSATTAVIVGSCRRSRLSTSLCVGIAPLSHGTP